MAQHSNTDLFFSPLAQLVVERSHMSGEFFSLYLQQNYMDFFSDVDDVARASEYLSDADFLTAEWSVSPSSAHLIQLISFIESGRMFLTDNTGAELLPTLLSLRLITHVFLKLNSIQSLNSVF